MTQPQEAISVTDTLALFGVEPSPGGRYTCPWCPEGHTPSLAVWDDRRWRCFRCDIGGMAARFASRMWGVPVFEALPRLREALGIEAPEAPSVLMERIDAMEKECESVAGEDIDQSARLAILDSYWTQAMEYVRVLWAREPDIRYDPTGRFLRIEELIRSGREPSLDELRLRGAVIAAEARSVVEGGLGSIVTLPPRDTRRELATARLFQLVAKVARYVEADRRAAEAGRG